MKTSIRLVALLMFTLAILSMRTVRGEGEKEIPKKSIVLEITSVKWNPNGMHGVNLNVEGNVSTPGWKDFELVKSSKSTSDHLIFDAMGVAPTGIVNQVITQFNATQSLPAGKYTVTVHAKNNYGETKVDYSLGDPN